MKCDCRDLPEWTVQTWVWPVKGHAGDTWQVHWGSASPNAEQLGPGCPRPVGLTFRASGAVWKNHQSIRSEFPAPAEPALAPGVKSWWCVGVREDRTWRGHLDQARLLQQPECCGVSPAPLLTAITHPEATEQALPCNFHRPCCQSGLTLSLPVSPGWAEGGARLLPWGVVVGSAGPWGQRWQVFAKPLIWGLPLPLPLPWSPRRGLDQVTAPQALGTLIAGSFLGPFRWGGMKGSKERCCWGRRALPGSHSLSPPSSPPSSD